MLQAGHLPWGFLPNLIACLSNSTSGVSAQLQGTPFQLLSLTHARAGASTERELLRGGTPGQEPSGTNQPSRLLQN